jgi:hypothetical protein
MTIPTPQEQQAIVHTIMSDESAFPITLPILEAWAIISALRLAAEHPARTKAGATNARQIKAAFEDAITSRHPKAKYLFEPGRMSQAQFARKMKPILSDAEPVTVNITIRQEWMILANIQLAARHPDMNEANKARLVQIAEQLEAHLLESHPQAQALIGMGWNPEFDR